MRSALVPKEHGAYGQLAFPLVTALAIWGPTAPALLMTLAIVAGFLAHEPALVLLGLRGPRAKREHGRSAVLWLVIEGALTIAAGVLALRLSPPHIVWSFLLPLVPAALLVIAIATRQEKSWHAEVAVALTFSLAAVPLCLASGSTVREAFAVAIPFALIFVAGTLAVRTVILRVRGGGDRHATAITRTAVLSLTLSMPVLLAVAAVLGLLPWSAWMATVPGLLLALWVAVAAPAPARLKAIGWSLVAASTLAALILIAA
jgi:hypothetical protein